MTSLSNYKLSDLSTETLELMDHYGLDAVEKLHAYSLTLEDALEEANDTIKKLKQELAANGTHNINNDVE